MIARSPGAGCSKTAGRMKKTRAKSTKSAKLPKTEGTANGMKPAPNLAVRLREARRRLRLSVKELAKRLDTDPRALRDYESGRVAPDGSVLAAYGRLGIDLNWLVLGQETSVPVPVAEAAAAPSMSPYSTQAPVTEPQSRSRSYLLPVQDTEFLLRRELRGLRFALEYEKPELLLRDAGIRSTVIVFGSARIPSREEAELQVKAARSPSERQVARRRLRQSAYYEEARSFGQLVSERGGALNANHGLRDNVIATGGGPGIMEAACRGASEAGAPAIGFNISLPLEQAPNRFTTPNLTFQFHYFAMRKMHLAMRANALAVFPGGFGTMDEMFEILTLMQTRKAPPIPVVLFGRKYWREVVNFEALYESDMVSLEDLALFEIVDTAEEAWDSFLRRGLKAHTPPEESRLLGRG
jgi:uncharacterized protein (TIGR00730 family)